MNLVSYLGYHITFVTIIFVVVAITFAFVFVQSHKQQVVSNKKQSFICTVSFYHVVFRVGKRVNVRVRDHSHARARNILNIDTLPGTNVVLCNISLFSSKVIQIFCMSLGFQAYKGSVAFTILCSLHICIHKMCVCVCAFGFQRKHRAHPRLNEISVTHECIFAIVLEP